MLKKYRVCVKMRQLKFGRLCPRFVMPLLILLLALVPVRPAHAYLDPASASAIIHGLISALAASVVALRLYWARVKTFFLWLRGKSAGRPADFGIQDKSDMRPPNDGRTH